MSSSADVRSIHALGDLKAALIRFGAEVQEALNVAEWEIGRTLSWLAERERYWRNQDPSPEVEWEYLNVLRWTKLVEEAAATYRQQAYRLASQVGDDLPKATAKLGRQIVTLESYVAMTAPPGMGPITIGSSTTIGSSNAGTTGAAATSAPIMAGLPGNMLGGGPVPGSANLNSSSVGPRYAPGSGTVASGSAPGIGSMGRNMAPSTGISGSSIAPGIQDVPLDQIDLSDTYVHNAGDFRASAPHDEMLEGVRKLEVTVRPAVFQGADGEYFSRLDADQGLDYQHGYRHVYDAFYGSSDPIRLERAGNSYKVVGGYHRLFIALELGLMSIPAYVVEALIP